jgi:hypothetical protein
MGSPMGLTEVDKFEDVRGIRNLRNDLVESGLGSLANDNCLSGKDIHNIPETKLA